jgi:hypothetical protein
VRASENQAVFALVAERLVVEQRGDVEPQILGVVGKRLGEFLQRHDINPF